MVKNKKLLYLIGLILFMTVIIVGGTFSWLLWSSSEEDKTKISFTATGSFSCSATGVNTIDGDSVSLIPTDCTKEENAGHVIKKEISTLSKNTSGSNAYLNMWLNIDELGSYLANSDNFKYTLTTTDNNCATDVVYSGNFKDLASGGKTNILESKKFTGTENNTYYLWIWLDEAETTPPEADETTRSFSLSLGGECTSQEVVESFTITNKEVNYQAISITANNTQRNIVSYAIVSDTPSDSDWVAISEAKKTYTLNHVLSTAGEYKIWFKDVDGNTINDTVSVANIDTTSPVCTFGSFSKTQIKNQETSTISLTCTDPETNIKDINLTKDSFTYDNKLITISNVVRESTTNGYKYTLTITGKGLDGDTLITLPKDTIENNGELGNAEVSSSSLVVLNGIGLSNLTITLSNDSYTYDGKSKTPDVVVKDGSKTLTLDKDYTIEYKDNINAGTGKIIITGKGNYSGSTTKTFTINKATATCKINSVPTLKYPSSTSGNLTYSCTGDGIISVASGNTNVITASKTSNTVISLTAKGPGTSKITISQAESTNYTGATISQDITVSAEEFNINFDGNIFNSVSETISDVTITYDYENSYLTLNGTPTSDAIILKYQMGLKFVENDKYTIKLTYVSGSYTNAGTGVGYISDYIVDSLYQWTPTPNWNDNAFISSGSSSAILTVNSSAATAGAGTKYLLFFQTPSDWTFNNYKVKIDFTKNDTKKISYGSTYGSLPIPKRDGFTFSGWYTEENGTGTKINSGDIVNITKDTTFYAKWTDDIGPYGTANLSLSGTTYTLTLSDQGDDGSGLNTTYGFALTNGTCETATYENQTGTSKTYSDTFITGATYYGCVKLTDKVGNISYIRSAGVIYSFDTWNTSGSYTYTVPATGLYKLEVWGAQGGQYSTTTPGYGSYSVGYANLSKGTILYIVNGGSGITAAASATFTDGGYNGGGKANYGAGTGGGATHIATVNGLLSTLSSQTGNILIVAGGGGGTGVYNTNETGGSGGGISGVTGGHNSSSWQGGGGGGTQTAGGTLGSGSVLGTVGTFGFGGSGGYETTYAQGAGGGGGGYYGGAGGSARNGGGGGGSGYIGNSLLTNKYMYCYNCTTSDAESTKTYTTTNVSNIPTIDYAKSGSGATRITFNTTTVKLTYNNNGGYGCNTKSVIAWETYGELCAPIRDGYKFEGWFTDASAGTQITSTSIVPGNSDHTLFAHWTQSISPIISFESNGNGRYVKGNVSSRIIVSRGNAELNTTTFKYIYSTSNTATPNISFNSGNSYTLENVTGVYYLIAQACDVNGACTTEVSNPFYLDNESPTGTINSSTTDSGIVVNVSANDPLSGIKEYGYLIEKGTTTCPTSGYIASENSTYNFANAIVIGTYTVCVKVFDNAGNETILTNAIVKDKVNLKVNLNGGNTTQTFNSTYNQGDTIALSTPTNSGYTFLGWKITKGNGKILNNIMIDGSFENGVYESIGVSSSSSTNLVEGISITDAFAKFGSHSVMNYHGDSWAALYPEIGSANIGHIYYYAANIYNETLGIYNDEPFGAYIDFSFKYDDEQHWGGAYGEHITNVWQKLSVVRTAPNVDSTIVLAIVDSPSSSKTHQSYADGVIVIDLTESYGAGNEPTKEWLDANIEYFDDYMLVIDDEDTTIEALWKIDNVNININGAVDETITVTDTAGNTITTISTDSNGKATATLTTGDYIFTSNIAKSTTDSSANYSKTITVSEVNQTINFYPDNSFYWYGNGDTFGESIYENSGGFTASKNGTFYCNDGLGCDYATNTGECLGSSNYQTSLRSLYMMANAQSSSNYNLTIKSVNTPPSGKKAHVGYKIVINQKYFSNGNYYYCEYSASFNGKSFTSCSANESSSNTITSNNTSQFYFSFSPKIVNYSCLWVYAIWYE